MTFVENGLGGPHDFGKLESGGVESPIGTDGEKARDARFFSPAAVLFHYGNMGGGPTNQEIIETTQGIQDRAQAAKEGLTEALRRSNEAARVANDRQVEEAAKAEEAAKLERRFVTGKSA